MTKPKAPTKVVGANIKARKSAKRSQNEKQFDEFADELKTLAERKTKATKNLNRSSR